MPKTKSCINCAYRKGQTCLLSGYYYKVERRVNVMCDSDFSGWVKKQSIINKLLSNI